MIAVSRTSTRDMTPPLGVDAQDLRSIHTAIGRSRALDRLAIWVAVVALVVAVAALTLVLMKGYL